jgi:hypothetical protein
MNSHELLMIIFPFVHLAIIKPLKIVLERGRGN